MDRVSFVVDADLRWVLNEPVCAAGATRPPTASHLAAFSREFEALRAGVEAKARGQELMAAAVASAILEALAEPPELPFIGEPFGGEGGTD